MAAHSLGVVMPHVSWNFCPAREAHLEELPRSWRTQSAEKKHYNATSTFTLTNTRRRVVTARDVHAASPTAAMLANLPPSCARGFRVTASALLLFYPFFSPYPICCFFRPPSYVFRVMLPRRSFCRCAVLETFSVFLSARYSLHTTINTLSGITYLSILISHFGIYENVHESQVLVEYSRKIFLYKREKERGSKRDGRSMGREGE